MLIPLQTKGRRITVSVGISVRRPMELGVILYDPAHANTHYVRRKLVVNDYREIQLNCPVTPEKCVLEVYDKNNGSAATASDFKIVSLKINPLPTSDTWATPQRHRYMDFAIDFARKAGYVAPGFYPSPGYEFLIHYVPSITDETGKELVTPARVHRFMPRVQLSQRLFKQFSIPVRVAILAHEGCHYFLNTRSEKEADLCGIRYYLDYGFPRIEAIYAATEVFLKHPETVGDVHLQRTKDIEQFINQYKQKQVA